MRYAFTSSLKPGDVVAQAVLSDEGLVLIAQNVALSENMIRKLAAKHFTGIYIYDDVTENVVYRENVSAETRLEAVQALKKMDLDACMFLSKSMTDSLMSQGGELETEMSSLGSYDTTTYSHSVNVAVYAGTFGAMLKLPYEKLQLLISAALLHDIGKELVDISIVQKPGKLTPKEYEEIKKHPQYGYDLLKDRSDIASVVRVSVLEHHENADGTGYPTGKMDEDTYEFAKIIHICDVYDAMLSKRTYKDAINPKEVVEFIEAQAGKMFNAELARKFTKCICPYPVGIPVLLSNYAEAVVVSNNADDPVSPVVRLMDSGVDIDLSVTRSISIQSVLQKEKRHAVR